MKEDIYSKQENGNHYLLELKGKKLEWVKVTLSNKVGNKNKTSTDYELD
jgi:hypothetical protein